MNIVIATPLYPPEIEILAAYVKDLAERLKRRHQITILAYAGRPEKISGVNIVVVNKRQPFVFRILKYTFELFRISRQSDIIYAQNAVASGLPAIIVRRLLGIPVVVNFAEDEAWKRSVGSRATDKSLSEFLESLDGGIKIRLIMKLQGWVLRRASAVMVSSSALSKMVTRVYQVPENRVAINYDVMEREEKLPFDANLVSHQIFATGRLTRWAGMEAVIRSVAILKREFADIRLIITGDGPVKAKLKDLVREVGVFDNVVFRGCVSRAENWYLRQSSQAHIHNYAKEDLSQSILESFLAGVPVLAADTNLSRELLFDGRGGILFEWDNENDMSQKISAVLRDRALRDKTAEQAKIILAEKFSWRTHIDVLTGLLESARKK